MISIIGRWSQINTKEPNRTTFYDLHQEIWDLSMEQKRIRKEIRREKRIRENKKNEKHKKHGKKSDYDLHSDIWYRCKKDLEIRASLQNKLHTLHKDQLIVTLNDIHHNRLNRSMKIKDGEPHNELEQKIMLLDKKKPT